MKVEITKIKSTIGCDTRILKIMMALGFAPKCNIGKKVCHNLTPPIQGMIKLVGHLVSIENK
jgi:ribosomal protein L30